MSWPLNISNFTFWDRIKICSFFLNPKKFWTMGEEVKKIESKMASYADCRYSIFTSSGSSANTLLAMMLRDESNDSRNEIIFPTTTWITSVSPFIREGFEPRFIDISLEDLSIDLNLLERYLELNSNKVKCVFLTSLIGFTPDIGRIQKISKKFKVRFLFDNCENHLGKYKSKNINHFFTSTTSTYFGHLIQSVEGGFIFTNDKKEMEYLTMARNHGMTRSLIDSEKYENKDVDPRFDFYLLGNNFRNSNINAFICSLDFKRESQYIKDRISKYSLFKELNDDFLIFPKSDKDKVDVPFCLPIILKKPNKQKLSLLKQACVESGIELRPIISGNLLRQTAFKKYHPAFEAIKNSDYLHDNSFYVGLNSSVSEQDIKKFSEKIKSIIQL